MKASRGCVLSGDVKKKSVSPLSKTNPEERLQILLQRTCSMIRQLEATDLLHRFTQAEGTQRAKLKPIRLTFPKIGRNWISYIRSWIYFKGKRC